MFNWQTEKRPIVALSPMADMTDSAFCRIAKRLGCRIVFREMVSAEAIVRQNQKTFSMAAFDDEERPIVQQIFGADPMVMAEATQLIDEQFQPDAFDLNMGCPANKIVGNFNGAALMKEPERASMIIRAVKTATTKPVSVKTRLGWSRPDEILEFIRIIQDAGADLVTIHGRTKEQGYSGQADWLMIGRAKTLISIPVLVNGDVFTPQAASAALKTTGADGVMIARGALGNPWIFSQVEKFLATGNASTDISDNGRTHLDADLGEAEHSSDAYSDVRRARSGGFDNGMRQMCASDDISDNERKKIVIDHARLHLHVHQTDSLVTFRKHLSWYFKGRPCAKVLRERLVKINTLTDLEQILREV